MPTRRNTTAARDVAQTITDLIISKIEAGTLPWRRPWKRRGMGGAPLRANGVAYTGINSLYLWVVADHYGYSSRYWMTYRQAAELGGQVRKGEKSEPSVYFNTLTKAQVDQTSGDEVTRQIRFLKSYAVFNASQIDGLPSWYYPDAVPEAPPTPSERQAAIEAFFSPIPTDVRYGGDSAFYSPTHDFIQMPDRNSFTSEDGLVATLAHETGHWTGHTSRCDRKFGKRFGDNAYAFEELVAEQISARICYELGLPADLHDSHASYIGHWLEILKSDKTAIITAAAKADQAFQYLAAFSGYQPESVLAEPAVLPAAA